MSNIDRTASIEMLTSRAISVPAAAFVATDHDAGLCHHHHWARDAAADRRSFPRVSDAARVATPSSATHDDIHYAS